MPEFLTKSSSARTQAKFEGVMGFFEGAVVSAIGRSGNLLGLCATLRCAGPVTTNEVASKANLKSRRVRIWLRTQPVTGGIDYRDDGRSQLPAETAQLLVDERIPRSAIPQFGDFPVPSRGRRGRGRD